VVTTLVTDHNRSSIVQHPQYNVRVPNQLFVVDVLQESNILQQVLKFQCLNQVLKFLYHRFSIMAPAVAAKVQATTLSMLGKAAPEGPPGAGASSGQAGSTAVVVGASPPTPQLVAPAVAPQAFGDAGAGAGVDPAAVSMQVLQTTSALSLLQGLGGGGGGPGGASNVWNVPGNRDQLKEIRRLLLQIEARMRVIESIVMVNLKQRADNPSVMAAKATASAYYSAAELDPEGHGQGPPHALIAASYLRQYVNTRLPDGMDYGIRARFAAMLLLVIHLLVRDFSEIPLWIQHFAVATLPPDSSGNEAAIVSFAIQGTVSLPDEAQLAEVITAAELAFATNDFSGLAAYTGNCFSITDGEPRAAGAHAFQVQKILTSLLCTTGATKQGKAPKGGRGATHLGQGRQRQGQGQKGQLKGSEVGAAFSGVDARWSGADSHTVRLYQLQLPCVWHRGSRARICCLRPGRYSRMSNMHPHCHTPLGRHKSMRSYSFFFSPLGRQACSTRSHMHISDPCHDSHVRSFQLQLPGVSTVGVMRGRALAYMAQRGFDWGRRQWTGTCVFKSS